jgi:hypothetical protein
MKGVKMNYVKEIFSETIESKDTSTLYKNAIASGYDSVTILTDGYIRAVIYQLERHKTLTLDCGLNDSIINSIKCAAKAINKLLPEVVQLDSFTAVTISTTQTLLNKTERATGWFEHIIPDLCLAAGCRESEKVLYLSRPVSPSYIVKYLVKDMPNLMVLKGDCSWNNIIKFAELSKKDGKVAVINLNDSDEFQLEGEVPKDIKYIEYENNDGLFQYFNWLINIVWNGSTYYDLIKQKIAAYRLEAAAIVAQEFKQQKGDEKAALELIKEEERGRLEEEHRRLLEKEKKRRGKDKAKGKWSLSVAIVINNAGEKLYLHPKSTAFKALLRLAEGNIENSKDHTSWCGVAMKYIEFLYFLENNNKPAHVILPDGREFNIKYTPGVRGGYSTSTVERVE